MKYDFGLYEHLPRGDEGEPGVGGKEETELTEI